jgi:hypothetical protein
MASGNSGGYIQTTTKNKTQKVKGMEAMISWINMVAYQNIHLENPRGSQ